jgi:hypothetical protein
MTSKHEDDQVETIAQRRSKYTQLCEQTNRQIRTKFTLAQATESNLRVRRKLYDGNLERTKTPGKGEGLAYIKYLEDVCEELKDTDTLDG